MAFHITGWTTLVFPHSETRITILEQLPYSSLHKLSKVVMLSLQPRNSTSPFPFLRHAPQVQPMGPSSLVLSQCTLKFIISHMYHDCMIANVKLCDWKSNHKFVGLTPKSIKGAFQLHDTNLWQNLF